MSDNKKYYWLKLKEDFFEEDAIAWLEEQENGTKYCLFYLKLCLKSLKSNGILIRNVGSMLVPYDAKALAKITNTDIDTVILAMELFTKIGLVQKLENGEFFMTQLENMVGSETKWAEKKRLQRQKRDNVPKISGQSLTEIEKEIDIDIELEKEKDIDKDINKDGLSVSCFSYFNQSGIMLTPNQSEEVKTFLCDGIENDAIIKAVDEAVGNGKRNYNYVRSILNNWIANNIKTVSDVENNRREFQESKKKGGYLKNDTKGRTDVKSAKNVGETENNMPTREEMLRQIRELDNE